uniref:Transmembrane protein 106A n=1 Tax=Rhabditophanes sp. KR3021 TaxID=114890 RepID=A0AC35U2U5_9BILA
MPQLPKYIQNWLSDIQVRFNRRQNNDTDTLISTSLNSSTNAERNTDTNYEANSRNELQVCPSCKGTGRVQSDEVLVALIPVNDERLKPKRTCVYVSIGIGICALLATAAIFTLLPRPVTLNSKSNPIETVNVFEKDDSHMQFHFLNAVNITNANYFVVKVTNVTSTIINKFQPWSNDVIGTGLNDTQITIMPLSSVGNTLWFNNTIALKGYVAQYCQSNISQLTPLYVTMQFDVSVVIDYLKHSEMISLTTTQAVCCIPSGNCTAPF